MSANVSAWDEPIAPSTPVFTGTWTEPVAGNAYYIYNVRAAQFLGTGLDWGTRTCTTVEEVVTVNQEAVTVEPDRNFVVPFELVDAGVEDYYGIRTMNTSKGAAAYVSAWGSDSWSDFGMSDDTKWKFASLGDGKYDIQAMKDNSLHLCVNTIGGTTSYAWVLAQAETLGVEWKLVAADDAGTEAVKTYCYVTYKSYDAALALYTVKRSLYDVLVEADALGIDNAAAGAVYTNAASTKEELQAALDALKPVVDEAAFKKAIAESSENNPVEVTKYVFENPDFSVQCQNGQTPPGWEVTVTGTNIGQQNREDKNPDTGLAIDHFIECWRDANEGSLGNGYIGQWMSGLPQGRYRLTVDVAACNQKSGFDPGTITGVYLFASDGQNKVHGEESIGTAPYGIVHVEWDFDFNAEQLLIGLLIDGTNANWVSADNFRLFAIGAMKEDPSVTGLRQAIAEGEDVDYLMPGNNIENRNIYNVSSEAAEGLRTAIANAKSLLGAGTAEERGAAAMAISDAIEDVKESATVYLQYQNIYEEAMLTALKLNEANQWPALQNSITEWAEGSLGEAFNEGSLTEEGLTEARGKVDELIAAFIGDGSVIEAGDELTVLIKNADFSRGQYYSDAATFDGDENDIPGWTVVSGNIKELSGTYHNIEAIYKTFDFQQTIKNLPAGTYRVTVQGYVRVDGGENNMVLYAGISEKKFMEITEEYSPRALLSDGNSGTSDGTWPWDTPRTDGLGYQPNSMQGANVYFNTVNEMTGKPYYLNDVTIVHTGGDLTIGVKCQSTGLWILWDNFTLTYVSKDAIEPILEDVDAANAELDELLAYSVVLEKTRKAAEAIQGRVIRKNDITTMEEALALLADVNDMIERIKTEKVKLDELQQTCELYLQKAADVALSDNDYLDTLDEIDTMISGEGITDVAQINDYMGKMTDGFAQAYIRQLEPGADATAIIKNPDFETGDASYWAIVPVEDGGRIGANQGYQNNATYDNADIHVEKFIEAWRDVADGALFDGDICQSIGVLPEAYYRLEMDGFAIRQGGMPDEGLQGVYLFAQNGSQVATTPVSGVESYVPEHMIRDFHADGVNPVKIGIRVSATNANWTLGDNFRLTYLGATSPDAIEGVVERLHTAVTIFTLDGCQSRTLRRGMNILIDADGNAKKVWVK